MGECRSGSGSHSRPGPDMGTFVRFALSRPFLRFAGPSLVPFLSLRCREGFNIFSSGNKSFEIYG